MNRFAGSICKGIEKSADVIGFFETNVESTHYVCIDSRFQPSDCIMAGAPSLQFFFEKRDEGWLLLIFVDTRSTTLTGGFTKSPDNPLIRWLRNNVWEESSLFCSAVNSLEDTVEELQFFGDFNIPLLGYAASSEALFLELEALCETMPKLFSDDETKTIGAQSIVSNIIAVENQKYTDSSSQYDKYLIPSVGMGEMELWIGTNPSFYARIVPISPYED